MFFHHKKLIVQVTGMHCSNCLDRIKILDLKEKVLSEVRCIFFFSIPYDRIKENQNN